MQGFIADLKDAKIEENNIVVAYDNGDIAAITDLMIVSSCPHSGTDVQMHGFGKQPENQWLSTFERKDCLVRCHSSYI